MAISRPCNRESIPSQSSKCDTAVCIISVSPKLLPLQRYTVLNALPKSTEEIKNVANMIYQRMVEREDEAIQKLHQVIAFATGEDCKLSSQVRQRFTLTHLV